MYQKGDLKITTPPCESFEDFYNVCDFDGEDNHIHTLTNRSARESAKYKSPPDMIVFLPHSCDEWVIGGAEEVETLIDDLQNLLVKLKTQ